jgi:hypothetical protein
MRASKRTKVDNTASLLCLPSEILIEIYQFLWEADIVCCMQTCRLLHEIGTDVLSKSARAENDIEECIIYRKHMTIKNIIKDMASYSLTDLIKGFIANGKTCMLRDYVLPADRLRISTPINIIQIINLAEKYDIINYQEIANAAAMYGNYHIFKYLCDKYTVCNFNKSLAYLVDGINVSSNSTRKCLYCIHTGYFICICNLILPTDSISRDLNYTTYPHKIDEYYYMIDYIIHKFPHDGDLHPDICMKLGMIGNIHLLSLLLDTEVLNYRDCIGSAANNGDLELVEYLVNDHLSYATPLHTDASSNLWEFAWPNIWNCPNIEHIHSTIKQIGDLSHLTTDGVFKNACWSENMQVIEFARQMISQLNPAGLTLDEINIAYVETAPLENIHIEQYLVDMGANDFDEALCLLASSSIYDETFLDILFNRGITDIGSVLENATSWKNVDILIYLYKKIPAEFIDYVPGLFLTACEDKSYNVVDYLMENFSSHIGPTVIQGLYMACKNNDIKTLQYLLPHVNSNVNIIYALLFAYTYKNYECMQYLLKNNRSSFGKLSRIIKDANEKNLKHIEQLLIKYQYA